MNDSSTGKDSFAESDDVSTTQYHKKDFWSTENLKYSQPHYRLEKSARIVSKLSQGKRISLLDVGCGPAALMRLLPQNIQYYGIDIAIKDPAPNLLEVDFLEAPIGFGDRRFDIVLAQGVFEYFGGFQEQKFAEIVPLVNPGGTFVVSYVNFGHHAKHIYWPYSNIQPLDDFRRSLARCFDIRRHFPTSHNWHHSEPNREPIRFINMHMNMNIPVISPKLAVEYFFICSPREQKRAKPRSTGQFR